MDACGNNDPLEKFRKANWTPDGALEDGQACMHAEAHENQI